MEFEGSHGIVIHLCPKILNNLQPMAMTINFSLAMYYPSNKRISLVWGWSKLGRRKHNLLVLAKTNFFTICFNSGLNYSAWTSTRLPLRRHAGF
jgi:hypothetical protein